MKTAHLVMAAAGVGFALALAGPRPAPAVVKTSAPYTILLRKVNGLWIFTDPSHGVVDEPLVKSATDIISAVARQAGNPPTATQLVATFSDRPFPGFQARGDWLRAENGGNWYQLGLAQGWLCPVLYKYFPVAPKRLYFALSG